MTFKKLGITNREAAVITSHFSLLTSHLSQSDQ
jgi:hypothetical protein